MKELIILPIFGIMILSMAVQLESIAKDSSQKALNMADDMNSAMDCAALGIPIKECAPDLMKTDFTREINRTMDALNSIKKNKSTEGVSGDAIMINSTTIIYNGTTYVAA